MRSARWNLAAALSDLEHVMHRTMNESSFYETSLLHESVVKDVWAADVPHDRVLVACAVQKAQECWAASTEIVEDKKRAMKSESVKGKSSKDTRTELAIVLANLGTVTRAEMSEVIESFIASIHEMMKAEVGETLAETFGNALRFCYLDLNEGLQYAMFNIVKHALAEVVWAGRGKAPLTKFSCLVSCIRDT